MLPKLKGFEQLLRERRLWEGKRPYPYARCHLGDYKKKAQSLQEKVTLLRARLQEVQTALTDVGLASDEEDGGLCRGENHNHQRQATATSARCQAVEVVEDQPKKETNVASSQRSSWQSKVCEKS
jgi:predicted ribosome quality control (RQC) complex YloA/Tae2 family protein